MELISVYLILIPVTFLNLILILELFWGTSLVIFYVGNHDNAFLCTYVFFYQLDYEGLWALYICVMHRQ